MNCHGCKWLDRYKVDGNGYCCMVVRSKTQTSKVRRPDMAGLPRAKTVKAVADYFGVSVDYLKGDGAAVNVETVQDNHGIIGHTHAPVTIVNGNERKLSEQEMELLSVMDRAKLLVFANELQNK